MLSFQVLNPIYFSPTSFSRLTNMRVTVVTAIISCLLFSLDSIDQVLGVPRLAPALYVFGDSLLDSGNNNFLLTLAKANFNPYGVKFSKGATGRFTNGRTVADFVAEYLGLPYTPPSVHFVGSASVTGLNYASGACGILPQTGSYIGKCLNLEEQINLFGQTVNRQLPDQIESKKALEKHLSTSIFLVSSGSNDYINNYLQPQFSDSSKKYTPEAFSHLLIDALSKKLEIRLYILGARKVVAFEIGPIGCMPSITRLHRHNGKCVEEINGIVNLFNNQLAVMLANIASSLPGSVFVLGHVHWLGYDAIMNPSKYGLKDTSNPCCVTWVNGTSSCIPELAPCQNMDKHFFWNGFHLTETAYSVIAKRCITDHSVCIPTSIQQLIQI